jgi:GNAT superfamily N-acetyltransferase
LTPAAPATYTPRMSDDPNLARAVDAAQSILATPAADQARSIERAFAECGRAAADAMARLEPASGASVRSVAGGLAIYAGVGSPCTQALGVGLNGPVTDADLDVIEAHLRPKGEGAVQIEICPFADPSLAALLASRGYRLHEWQLAWTRDVADAIVPPSHPADPQLQVRAARPGEEEAALRVVMAGFLESDDVPADAMALMRPFAHATGYEMFVAQLGDELIGGATLSVSGGIAFISGSGVRPAFRRRGAQGALLRARLERARALGCRLASSTTQPGTASRRNMERHGFSVAYPKIVMLKG